MQTIAHIVCNVCDSEAQIVEESRYDGLRGICFKCGGNWPES